MARRRSDCGWQAALQSLVYQHEPKTFLTRFEDFLATADKHGLKVLPILFDSCFGVAPSLESRHIWVANPGPDRMGKEWWPESDAYAAAVVSAHLGDKRIALWDVMNEPTATHLAATPEGKTQIDAFVAHDCALVKKLDATHAFTVGVAPKSPMSKARRSGTTSRCCRRSILKRASKTA
jgi:hypothetical protein